MGICCFILDSLDFSMNWRISDLWKDSMKSFGKVFELKIMSPGEFSATLQTGEAVLSRQAMSVSGRRETVEKWNSGGGAEKPASDEFAAGIERSSLPQLLSQPLKYQRATMLRLGVDPSRTDRPGHRRR